MVEHLAVGVEIPLGKYLLGSAYHLMHQVAAQLLKNEAVYTISGPWWLIQIWLNLYMHKIIRPNLQNLSFLPPTLMRNTEAKKEEPASA